MGFSQIFPGPLEAIYTFSAGDKLWKPVLSFPSGWAKTGVPHTCPHGPSLKVLHSTTIQGYTSTQDLPEELGIAEWNDNIKGKRNCTPCGSDYFKYTYPRY